MFNNCPFCKEKRDLGLYYDPGVCLWYIMCGNCCTKGPLSLKPASAEDRWNYRGEHVVEFEESNEELTFGKVK